MKDGPKRRRETTTLRARAPSTSANQSSHGVNVPFPPPKDSPPQTALPALPSLNHHSSISSDQMANDLDEMQIHIKSETDGEHQKRDSTPLSYIHPHSAAYSTPQMAYSQAPYHPMTPESLGMHHMNGAMGPYSTPSSIPQKRASTMNPLEALGGMI